MHKNCTWKELSENLIWKFHNLQSCEDYSTQFTHRHLRFHTHMHIYLVYLSQITWLSILATCRILKLLLGLWVESPTKYLRCLPLRRYVIFFWIMCYCKVINQSDNNHNNDTHFSCIVGTYLHICAWLFNTIRQLHASFWGPWFSKYCIDKLDMYVMLQPSSVQFGTFFSPK